MAENVQHQSSAPPRLVPNGWKEHIDDNGGQYYHHTASGKTQREYPTIISAPPRQVPNGWTEHIDDIGGQYYHHTASGKTQREYPTIASAPPRQVPNGWTEHIDDIGGQYYHHTASGKTQREYPTIASAPPRQVPNGWTEHIDDIGGQYYHHTASGKTQREYPTIAPGPPRQLPNGWTELIDATGCQYYHHTASGKTQWEYPTIADSTQMGGDSMEHGHNNTELIQKYTTLQKKNGKINGLELRNLKFEIVHEDSENCMRRISVGVRNEDYPTKSVLLVGATGTGKTSLVNSLLNLVYGVKFEDPYRIKIIEEECDNKKTDVSQTEKITVYEFNHIPGMSIEYNLHFIDTPGLNDTRGLDFDKLMFDRLEKVLEDPQFGITEINAIGLVTTASATRLTEAQKYVYDGCMRLFGNDVKDIMHIMATYCDVGEPAIIDGLESAGVKYKEIHKFNNSSIYMSNGSNKLTRLFWDNMSEACDKFQSYLKITPGITPVKTIATLENRRKLREKLRSIEEIGEPKKEKYPETALNCLECKVTCHKPCFGLGKVIHNCKLCKKFQEKDSCEVCRCPQQNHAKQNECFKNIFMNMNDESIKEIIDSYTQIHQCVTSLHEVALQPNTKSKIEYLSNLIKDKEENEGSSKADLESLKTMREEEEKIQTLNDAKIIEKMIRTLELNYKIKTGEIEPICHIL